MSFRISGLPRSHFEHLFALSGPDLRRHGAVRVTADRPSSFPCRVSLVDAAVGEDLILTNHRHQPAASPYQSSHAVFVRVRAADRCPSAGEVPDLLRSRLLSVRAFDQAGMMTDADVAQGTAIEPLIEQMLGDPANAYLHVHYAKPGCFAARVDRA